MDPILWEKTARAAAEEGAKDGVAMSFATRADSQRRACACASNRHRFGQGGGRSLMSNFRTIDRETGFLLPPSVDEWLPENIWRDLSWRLSRGSIFAR